MLVHVYCHLQTVSLQTFQSLRSKISTDESSKMRFYKKKVTWYEAQDNCRLEDMELASGRSKTEKKVLQKILHNEPGHTPLWVGLFNNTWAWSDGIESSFRYWGPTGPGGTGSCAMFDSSSKAWTLNDCETRRYFYCYNGKNMLQSHSAL